MNFKPKLVKTTMKLDQTITYYIKYLQYLSKLSIWKLGNLRIKRLKSTHSSIKPTLSRDTAIHLPLHQRKKFLLATFFLIFIAPVVIYLNLKSAKPVDAAWFNDSWAYRQLIPLANNTTEETNVYISVTLDSSDTDKFQGDCGDLRFTKQSGQLLPYYVSSGCGTGTTVVHVDLDVLPAGSQNLFFYYGSPTADNGFSSSDFSTEASDYTVSSLGSEETTPGPIGYWKFDEGYGTTANDSTPNAYNGTLSNTTWASEDQCVNGKCLNFNGSSSSIVTSSIPNLDSGMTASGWINVKAQPDYYSSMVASSTNGFVLYFTQSGDGAMNAYSQIYNGSSWTGISCTTNSNFNEWYFLSLTYNDSDTTAKVYLNGEKCSSDVNISGGMNSSYTQTINMGKYGSYWHDGYLDDIKIYPYARSASQIKSDYTARGSIKGTSVSIGSNDPDKSLSNGLVGYWKVDESSATTTVTDFSGNGNTGYLNLWGGGNTATTSARVSGKFNGGIDFDGEDDNVNFSPIAFSASQPWSAGFWINSDSSEDVITLGRGTASSYIATYFNQNYIYVRNTTGEQNYIVGTLNTSQWHHVMVTADGQGLNTNVYLDGTYLGAVSPGAAGTAIEFSQFGQGYSDNPIYALDGKMDEVRIYNRALSPDEVTKIYNYAPGPEAHYTFDEGSGTSTAYDSSGNGHDGTMVGSMTESDWVQGKYGKALEFDGEDDSLNLSPAISNPYQFTWEAWIKPNIANCSDRCSIIDRYFEVINDDLTFYSYDLASPGWHTATNIIVDNIWQHVVVQYDGSNLKMFHNGKNVFDLANARIDTLASANKIGEVTGGSRFFDGAIDDVRLYTYARTPSQIIQDMNASHPIGGSPIGSQVSYWKFDEGYGTTTNDSLLNNANGTLTGAAWSNQGKIGKALDFDETQSDRVTISSSGDLNSITNQITISTWVYWRGDGSGGDSQQMAVASGGSPLRFGTSNPSGAGNFGVYCNTCTTPAWYYAAPIAQDQWQHLVVTMDGSNITMYQDGVVTKTGTYAGNVISGTGSWVIGAYSGDTYNWNGLIDEVKIYSTALTQDEILLDYNQGSTMILGATGTDSSGNASYSSDRAYCIPGDNTSCSAPVAEWKMDEGTSTSIQDTTGNGNTGTLGAGVAAPTWSTGKTGKSLKFDGSDDYVERDSATALVIPGPLTINAWIKTTSNESGGIISRYQNHGVFLFKLFMNSNGTIGFYRGDDGVFTNTVTSIATVNDGSWHYLSGKYDGTNMQIYIDGGYDNQVAENRDSGSSGLYSLCIGNENYNCDLTGYNGHFAGSIDQITVYDYARTPAQIAWDYNRGKPVAHYKLDECQGTTAYDSSNNENNGTITIGGTGDNTSVGTCSSGTGTEAWNNGTSGKLNYSLDFDGTDDYINAGSDSSLNTPEDYTISMWVYNDDGLKTYPTLLNRASQSASNGFFWIYTTGTNDSNISFQFANGSSYVAELFTSALGLNTWTLVTFSFTDSDKALKLYINGNQFSTTRTLTNSLPVDDGTLYIGTYDGSTASYPFDGQLDDVKIFNYALTLSQIKNLYNGSSAVRFGP